MYVTVNHFSSALQKAQVRGEGAHLHVTDFACPGSAFPIMGSCSSLPEAHASGAPAGGTAMSDEAPGWSQW